MAAVLDGRRLHRWHAAVPELPESDQRSEPGVEHRLPRRRAATPPNPLGICSPERQIVAPRQPRSCNRARLARCQLAGARMHQCPRQQRVPITRCGSSPPPNRAEGRMHDPRPERPSLRSAAKRKECQSPRPASPRRSKQDGTAVADMPAGGLEPPHPCGLRILSPLRLPFRQAGIGRRGFPHPNPPPQVRGRDQNQRANRANISSCLLCEPWNCTAPSMAANSAATSWSVEPWNLIVQTRFRAASAAIHRYTRPSSRAG